MMFQASRESRPSARVALAVAFVAASFAFAPRAVSAFGCRPMLIPNGTRNSCLNCHMSPSGGDARNSFGLLIETVAVGCNSFWNETIAAADSDGDGFTNGQELQDPLGTWRPGMLDPGVLDFVSLPGDASSVPPITPSPTPSPSPTPFAAPSVVRQSASQVVRRSNEALFGVEAAGPGPLLYQWTANGDPVPPESGGTSRFLAVPPGPSREGTYVCTVTNPGGSAQTDPATLTEANDTFPNDGEFASRFFPLRAIRGQRVPVRVNMRNTGATTWGYDVALAEEADPDGIVDLPAVANPEFSLEVLIQWTEREYEFFVNAPETDGLYSADLRLAHVQNRESGVVLESFGPLVSISLQVGDTFETTLAGGPPGWYGGVAAGSGSVLAAPDGLRMTVPATGENLVGWVAPERFVPLIDRTAYRMRFVAGTDQTATDAIPLWDVVYDNFNSSGFGMTYLGQGFFLDQAGGANGVGRPGGRTDFEFWAAPNAAETMQWRGTIDPENSAFTPFIDAWNDMRVYSRVLDFDSAGVGGQFDSGTIRLESLTIAAIPFDALTVDSVEWGPPVNSATHEAQTGDQAAEATGFAAISNGEAAAFYQLAPTGPGSRKTLFPLDDALFDSGNPGAFPPLYPVVWTTDALYRCVAGVALALGEDSGDPVDAIFVNADTATHEVVAIHGSTRGSPPDNMFRAASPRLEGATGGVSQPYVGYFFGHNATSVDPLALPDANRLRPLFDLMNLAEIAGDESGADPVEVNALRVERISAP